VFFQADGLTCDEFFEATSIKNGMNEWYYSICEVFGTISNWQENI
jgi:hypothetical protein